MQKLIIFILLISTVTLFADNTGERLIKAGISVAREPIESIDFQLEDLDGNLVTLSEYKGKVVFLNFWATWCPPCRAEMPAMENLHQEFKDQGLVILAVDLREDKAAVKKFMDKNSFTFTALLDRTGSVGSEYNASAIPTTYLINREGKLFAMTRGAMDWDSQEILSLFREILQSGYPVTAS